MLILEDTRQQEQKHKIKHESFRRLGVQWNRTALYCGDYTLPANQSVCIDTKKDIAELIGDIQVKSMPKKDIRTKLGEIAIEYNLSVNGLLEDVFHAICDDDTERFAEKEINDICFKNNVPERVISEFQTLYIKRHGFFHRGLKRAQNSGIQLFVLVDNLQDVTDINSLFSWHNPRLDIMKSIPSGFKANGRVQYQKVRKYPQAMTGQTLAKACLTMEKKYGVEFLFCKPSEAGAKIIELLNRGDAIEL